MTEHPKPVRARRVKILAGLSLLLVAASLCGCQTFRYYKQAIAGECQILSHRQSILKLIADPNTSPELKAKFRLVLELLKFAESDLHLPAEGQYLRYVDLHRRFVVWNVHAAPEFSLEPKTWWYPFVGSLKYRGYFSEPGARDYARTLEKKGWQVYVEGVEAYSTLGWFKDPLLNTFIFEPAPDLAEILFHELAHQRLFISGETDFNEAFATAVGEEGVRRWLKASKQGQTNEHYFTALQRNEQFVRLIMDAREQLDSLYGPKPPKNPSEEKRALTHRDAAALRRQKEAILAQLRENYAKLKAQWGGVGIYDAWFAKGLSNAQLNTVAAYYDLVPGFRALLEKSGGDLEKFFKEVADLAKLKKEERHRKLKGAVG